LIPALRSLCKTNHGSLIKVTGWYSSIQENYFTMLVQWSYYSIFANDVAGIICMEGWTGDTTFF
jgi:hypothetical protein